MTDETPNTDTSSEFPSVDDRVPDEQGGPIARSGFTYQDFIAIQFFIEMVDDESIIRIQCETADDIVIVRQFGGGSNRSAEFVQVKTTTEDNLWSCARLCGSANAPSGESIYEKSLSNADVKEDVFFRLVTSQPVNSALKPLTYPLGSEARALNNEKMLSLKEDIDTRCPSACSENKNYKSKEWLEKSLWVEAPPLRSVEKEILLDMIRMSENNGDPIFYEQAEKILLELVSWVRKAGDAKWVPDKNAKMINREDAIIWWNQRMQRERDGTKVLSGGKLRSKMTLDVVSADMLESALELRRQYAKEVREPKYMQGDTIDGLSLGVRAKLMTLKTQLYTNVIDDSPKDFHRRCSEEVQVIANQYSPVSNNLNAISLGCMYDITDRCQHTFKRENE